ncbi:tyrosine-type recombinase/integrase [Paenarthrobacter nitroguajacolicus]|uniref:tyrosine-type recombinase/integrase n=1 Tax=Paenarthrobacter nitroguajacolicus TaxID=211146 RepID=UPI003AE3AD6D
MAEKKANGDGSIYRQKDGMWAGALTLGWNEEGKQVRKVVRRKDRGKLVAEMRRLKAELAEHGDLINGATTLGDWLAVWRDDIAPKDVRPKTMEGYRGVINNYIIPTIGKTKMEKLSADHVRKLHATMRSMPKNKLDRLYLRGVPRGRWAEVVKDIDPKKWPESLRGKPEEEWPDELPTLSSTYTLLAHNVLSSALEQAVKEKKLRRNVCELVDRPKARKTEQKALELDEAIQLLAHLASLPDGPLWAAYLLTGGRRGEVLGLECDRIGEEIDFSWQLQRIKDIKSAPDDFEYRHLKGTLYLTRPKSSAGWRIIPNVEPLRSFLGLAVDGRTEGLVFSEFGDDRPYDPDRASKRWKAVLLSAGLPEDVNLHGSRHTMADLLYYAGVPEDLIPMILGHSSRAMSRDYRTRSQVHRQRMREGMESISKLLTPELTQ